jgi:hypothetical protein
MAVACIALFTFIGLYQIYQRLEKLERFLPPFTPTPAPDKVQPPDGPYATAGWLAGRET